MVPARARGRALRSYDYPSWTPACHLCGQRLDDCVCVCPFCG